MFKWHFKYVSQRLLWWWFVPKYSLCSALLLELVSVCEHHWLPCRLRGSAWGCRQRMVMQSSPCLCFFFSPKTFTSSFDHSFILNSGYKHQVPLFGSLHKLIGGGKSHTHRETGIVCCGRNIVLFSPRCSAQFCSQCTGTDSLPEWARAQGISCICDYAERDVRKSIPSK